MPNTAQAGEFSRSLILTTPHLTGKKVKDAQWLLVGHNAFSQKPQVEPPVSTLTGRLDGEYGPVTAGATKEAKFELGYPVSKINNVFDQELYDLLTGHTKLPTGYMQERTTRLKKPVKLKALEFAITQIGTKEDPYGSNHQKYGKWYQEDGVPWCAIFDSYCINEALGTLDKPTWKYAYVPTIAQDAAEGKNHMSLTHAPEPGDLVTYNFSEPNCHVAFYEKDLGSGSFSDVGGNTGPSNFSNGGEVARSTRYMSEVSHFIRLSF